MKQDFYQLHKQNIARAWQHESTFLEAFLSVPDCQTCMYKRGIRNYSESQKWATAQGFLHQRSVHTNMRIGDWSPLSVEWWAKMMGQLLECSDHLSGLPPIIKNANGWLGPPRSFVYTRNRSRFIQTELNPIELQQYAEEPGKQWRTRAERSPLSQI